LHVGKDEHSSEREEKFHRTRNSVPNLLQRVAWKLTFRMKAINFLCIKLKCDITEIHRQFCHLLSFVSLLSTNRAVDQVSSSYPKMSTTALASKKPSELESHAFISDDLGHTSRQKVVSGQLGHLQLDLHLQVA